jgi:hypothetical protein
MSKVIRHQFMGSWLLFWLMSVTVIGIPLAILYLIEGTVRIDTEMEDPEKFIAEYKSRKLVAK